MNRTGKKTINRYSWSIDIHFDCTCRYNYLHTARVKIPYPYTPKYTDTMITWCQPISITVHRVYYSKCIYVLHLLSFFFLFHQVCFCGNWKCPQDISFSKRNQTPFASCQDSRTPSMWSFYLISSHSITPPTQTDRLFQKFFTSKACKVWDRQPVAVQLLNYRSLMGFYTCAKIIRRVTTKNPCHVEHCSSLAGGKPQVSLCVHSDNFKHCYSVNANLLSHNLMGVTI